MKSSYTRILFEVGLMEVSSRDRKITPVNLDYRICQYMRDRDMSAYLYAVVGGIRLHTLDLKLNKIEAVPVVMFFPGEYSGQDLSLFGKIIDDNYYRAFKLV